MGPPAARLSRRWFGPQARPAAAEEGKRRGCAVTQCRMLKMSVGLSQWRKNGGRTRARTWDPLIKSQLLYQLSYAPIFPATTGRRKPRENIRIRRKCKGFGPGKLLFCADRKSKRLNSSH